MTFLRWWTRGSQHAEHKVRRKAERAAKDKRRALDRDESLESLIEKAAIAEAEGNAAKMRNSSYKLLRFERYERAWQLRVRAAALTHPSPIPEWDGEDLAGKRILIESYAPKNRIGEEVRLARFIAPVAARAAGCTVLAEPRLVPLLRRSFPGADVRQRGVDDEAAFAEADVHAIYERIAYFYAKTAEELRRSYVKLLADPARVASIRQRYKAAGPLVGISWGSSNVNKVLPDLGSWAPLLGWEQATFVALQYGNIERDLAALRQLARGRVVHDTEIDQLVDLDAFAAQISALDAVVTISNTTVDLAGMLGARTLHVRDDRAAQIWPESGPSPWYPDMTFLSKRQRPWADVFVEARSLLIETLG